MKLLVLHPHLARRSCADCQRWLYDDEQRIVTRCGEPVPRPPASPTPCWSCPKRSPATSAPLERDLERIQRTLRLYFLVRATGGRVLSRRQALDPLLARNLALIDAIVRQRERLGVNTIEELAGSAATTASSPFATGSPPWPTPNS